MLKGKLLSEDINGICELIDRNSGEDGELDDFENFTINESLAFLWLRFLPIILKGH